ncbi:MAG: ABC transporter ATP-binding protein [Cyanobacteria bacterium J06632_3]
MHLEVSRLTKQFNTAKGTITALKNVNLHVEEGEFVCVVGASGCGKSTLLRLVAGLETPTSGILEVDDSPITGPSATRGMVFQDYTLYPWMTVQKNVEFGLKLQGVEPKVRREWASYFLEMVGLSQSAQSLPNQLSGGMKQRVAIARALTSQPKILLMDEPFGALDVQTKETMQQFMLDLWERTGTSILMITHDVEESIILANRVYVMSANPGRIQTEINIELSDRSPSIKTSATFRQYYKDITSLLKEPAIA